ncbi:MAG: hypothetical protein CL578_01290 [Alteromonadaceae bacterium]|uniref:hypothetical protein n=1 Tax=Paraglaciecola chathamensis TaxID=368405 RepID=UPI000C4C1FA1|nr:hypothetical protein [Paraglaciecola agarilytica]MBN23669.1 hypothetical protein [Alteromonadaceae bacterium]|tara:strand:- start:10401 stop:10877 length:477 start_codon:yes stop_codon:yes gene_type:complete
MKKIMFCLAVLLVVGCASTSRPIDNKINVAELIGGVESSQSNVTVYLNNEGTDRASVRFETRYNSAPKRIHKLYIFDEDAPKLKELLTKFQKNELTVDDMLTPLNFGRDKGIFGETKADGKRYVRINTVEGSYLFTESSTSNLIGILEQLQRAGKNKN